MRKEERARRLEQLRNLGAVYRRLVKVLHPDLERDPAERERKSRIMQDCAHALEEVREAIAEHRGASTPSCAHREDNEVH